MRTIRFANPMVAAQSIAKLLADKNKKFSPRPWNPHKPEESLWWVVPSTKWPAFDLGKISLWNEGPFMWCGLHVEKGLCISENAGNQVFPSKRGRALIVTDTWAWHTFMRDIMTSHLDKALADIHLDHD